METVVERIPGALQQHGVARSKRGTRRKVCSLPLDGQHDKVAAFCHHAREETLPDQGRTRRNQHLGQTGIAVEQLIANPTFGQVIAEGEAHVMHQRCCRFGRPLQHDDVALRHGIGADRSALGILQRHELQALNRQIAQIFARGTDQGRAFAHTQLVHVVRQPILLNQCHRVAAEIGGEGLACAERQKLFAEEHDNRDAAQNQRNADEGEFKVAKATAARVFRRLDHQHVHRAAGRHQFGARMGAKNERHQKL